MAYTQRAEPGRDVLRGLFTLVIVSGCGVAVVSILITASDAFSRYIIDQATAGNGFGQSVAAMLALEGPTVVGPVLLTLLGLIALIVSVLQIVLLLFRAGVLVLLAGLLPLAASSTSTAVGLAMCKRYLRLDRGPRPLSIIQSVSARAGWQITRLTGSNVYRAGPLSRGPDARFRLPGLAAQVTASEHRDAHGRAFVLLHAPARDHYTIVLSCDPDGDALVDTTTVDTWVTAWGAWLGALSDEAGIVAGSVTVETAPDSGQRLRSEVESNTDPAAPAVARTMLAEGSPTRIGLPLRNVAPAAK